jgi:hypothetical protein
MVAISLKQKKRIFLSPFNNIGSSAFLSMNRLYPFSCAAYVAQNFLASYPPGQGSGQVRPDVPKLHSFLRASHEE